MSEMKASNGLQEIQMQELKNVHFWCEELNLKAEDLKDIVLDVGPVVQNVREYLAKKFMASWPAYY